MKKRGRKRKLNDQQVKELREDYANKEDKRSINQLARYYKINPVTCGQVIDKKGAYKS